jgi:dimethylamine/trimethylamine dehydrogenase
VYDCDGYLVGPGIAERLRLDGYEVTIVTPFDVVSPVSDETLEATFLRQHLHELGIRVRRGIVVRSVSPGCVAGADQLGEPVEVGCASVVMVTQRASDSELWEELSADPAKVTGAGIVGLYRIGDAVAPRMTSEAVFDGHRLAMEIDTADPAVALPVNRRERI